MSDFTTNLQLPYLMPAQAQKHATVNEALRRLDALCQANAVSMSVTAQPASPADGDLYIVPSGKTGTDWANATNWDIGYYQDGLWHFVTPREGWLVWVKDVDGLFAWSGSAWAQVDVTTENVRSAGALMDDELANLAAVKAINQGLTTTSGVQFASLGIGAVTSGSIDVLHIRGTANQTTARIWNENAGFSGQDTLRLIAVRAQDAAYGFLRCYSGTVDVEFDLRGDGNAYCDGSWNGGGADYAEYFEWEDGNSAGEDRRGVSVVLDGDKICPATEDDDPADIIGVVSGNPSVVGDAAWNHWAGKYLRDDFGGYVMEPYSVIEWEESPAEEGGEPVIRSYTLDALPDGVTPPETAAVRETDDAGAPLMRRILNPDFDPATGYVPRADRPEWDAVGLMGKLRVRAGAPVGSRWIKLRDITVDVQEWLVR